MNNKDYFLALLRASLWQENVTGGVIAPPVCRSLVAMAKKQTVLGLLSDVLLAPENSFQMDKKSVIDLLVAQQTIAKQNQRADQVLVELCQLLRAHDIEFIVVKGQLLAQYYPCPQYRQSGDIDFYCDDRNFMMHNPFLLILLDVLCPHCHLSKISSSLSCISIIIL